MKQTVGMWLSWKDKTGFGVLLDRLADDLDYSTFTFNGKEVVLEQCIWINLGCRMISAIGFLWGLWRHTRTGSTICWTCMHTHSRRQGVFCLWKFIIFAELSHAFWTHSVSTAKWKQIQPPQSSTHSKTWSSFWVLRCKQFLSLLQFPAWGKVITLPAGTRANKSIINKD